MTARSSSIALQNITRDLSRSTQPSLPPAEGYEGHDEYSKQLGIWKKWIRWEKEDPLGARDDSPSTYKSRILYVYKQAIMPLRFWPELWVEAADFCYKNGLDDEGNQFLRQGTAANPESCLLAFKLADRIECTTASNQGDRESLIRRGEAVRQPYNKVINALYEIYDKTKERESQAITQINEAFSKAHATAGDQLQNDEDDADALKELQQAKQTEQITKVQQENKAQLDTLSRLISHSWISLMRAMRRVQGKGKLGDPVGGSRQIFSEARKRGRLNYEFWVANALLEKYAYRDPVGDRVFEKAYILYPEDEKMALAYINHLISVGDDKSKSNPAIHVVFSLLIDATDARAAFKKTTEKLVQKPGSRDKAKPLFAFFHDYESKYSELHLIQEIETRMSELFPDDPRLHLFSQRYAAPDFDPCAARPVVSPRAQQKPKGSSHDLKDQAQQPPPAQQQQSMTSELANSPRNGPSSIAHVSNSPKRPLEDSDNESMPARKIARGDSPLKGAAGRRLNAAKRTHLGQEVHPAEPAAALPATAPPPSLPPWVMWLLTATPKTEVYKHSGNLFNVNKMVEVIRSVDLAQADFQTWSNWLRERQSRSQPPAPRPPPPSQQPPPPQHVAPHGAPPMQHTAPLSYSAPPPMSMQVPMQAPQMPTPQYGYAQPNRKSKS